MGLPFLDLIILTLGWVVLLDAWTFSTKLMYSRNVFIVILFIRTLLLIEFQVPDALVLLKAQLLPCYQTHYICICICNARRNNTLAQITRLLVHKQFALKGIYLVLN